MRTSWRVEAPRVRSSAASRRRRSRAGRAIEAVTQPGEDRAGDAEEQEQQLRVERVLARLVERRAEVVADEAGAGQPRLEVARRPGPG